MVENIPCHTSVRSPTLLVVFHPPYTFTAFTTNLFISCSVLSSTAVILNNFNYKKFVIHFSIKVTEKLKRNKKHLRNKFLKIFTFITKEKKNTL